MAFSFPLSMPALPAAPTSVVWRQQSVAAKTESPFSLAQQIQVHQGERWVVELQYAPMVRAVGSIWEAWFAQANGMEGTFLLPAYGRKTARGSVPGTPQVNGASQAGKSLLTKGWTATQTGILLPGDFIQIGTGLTARLYMNLVSADSDGGGLATLDIWPRLRESPADSATIVVSNAVGLFRLANNERPYDINSAIQYGIDFVAVEAVP